MSTVLKVFETASDMQGISAHPAFKSNVSGLEAEKMLRGKKASYLYILREGEEGKGEERNYYVTFLDSEFVVRHQPFVVTEEGDEWSYENGHGAGPFKEEQIGDVVHLIMHCGKNSCSPFLS